MQDISKNRCRICLGNQNVADLFTHKIVEKISYCTTVQVSPEDPFPSKICKICGFYLNVAYVFRMVCEWTDFKLQQELDRTNSIDAAISNTLQAQCNEFSHLESEKHSSNKHLIDLLLKQEFLETYQFFGLRNNKVKLLEDQTLEDYGDNICKTQRSLEKDAGYIHQNLYTQIETLNEDQNIQLHQETEQTYNYVTSRNIHNEAISSFMNNTRSTTTKLKDEISLINETNSLINPRTCLINKSSLYGNEAGVGADTPLLQNAALKEVMCEDQNLVSDRDKINEDCFRVDEEKTNLSIQAPNAGYALVENCINNKNITNFINEKAAIIEQEILDEEKVLVDDAIYECETHQDMYNETIYGQVCLNTEDPLLHNVTIQENEEADLNNVETNPKNCFCIQNKPENPPNEKQITLSSISLHDFENFEKEQLNSTFSENPNDHTDGDKDKPNKSASIGQSENRVGRHIAKKNAGQPPKRYSPTPEAAKLTSLTQKPKIIKDDLSGESKLVKSDETEDKLKRKELKDVDSILDQEYILESDLSMPEPIFEETIVTDGYYFTNDDKEVLESNFDDSGSQDDAKMESGVKRNRNRGKKGSRNLKKKVNIFMDQTVVKPIRPRRNKYSIKNYTNTTKFQNQCPNGVESNHDDDDDYNSETEIQSNKSELYSSEDEDDNYENDRRLSASAKRKFLNKNNKKRTNTTCKICNKSFPFPSHLQRHQTAHIGIKRFVCKYCSKEFLHRYNLSVHLRSHTGNFPLKCNICNRGFVSSSVLERHKRSHTGETPFRCQYCLQLFSHASSLNMHEKMHLSRPSFPCDVCYKVFSYKSSLNAHKKGHSGFKAHSCSVCHKRFTRRTSVLRHMACHSEVKKKFKCQTCGEVLGSQGNLVKHQKMH